MYIRQATIKGPTYTATIEPDNTVTIDRDGELYARARWDEEREMIYGDGGTLTAAELAELTAALRATPPRPMTCAEVYARIGYADMEALSHWRRLANEDSDHLGGRGQSLEQIRAVGRAWDALPPSAHQAYISMLCSTVYELADAIRDMGIPKEAKKDIDAIEALLGPDHPAFRILPADTLISAYKTAMEQEQIED